MKIAVVAPFEEPVPPRKYGGTEVVVYNLVTELHGKGHEVTLFATGDSVVPCRLVPVFEQALRTQEPFASDAKTREMGKIVGISKVLHALITEQFDIIHNHIGWRFNPFSHLLHAPVVTTLHGPGGSTYQKMIHEAFPEERFISISNNQRASFPELQYVETVYNGIDIDLYPFKEQPEEDYLFFLARFSPEKGPRQAIEIAKKTGKKLKMAVKIDQVDKAFFEEMKPLMQEAGVELIGEIGMQEKVALLQNASALLAPIQWEEPFGLFVVESMACGTPVVGMNRGSFPELITHGVDGYLGSSVDELVSFVERISSINRRACRKTVEDRFTKQHMAERYLSVYESVISSHNA